MTQLTWLITGCSSGFGEELAKSALKRGDKVIATARGSTDRLEQLRGMGAATLELDVCAPQDTINSKTQKALAIYGSIDVLVNNAGYIEAGLLEDLSHEQTLKCMNTNFFGAVNVSRAVLPTFREKKSGTIVWIGSIAGWDGDLGGTPYCASKFAMEGEQILIAKFTFPIDQFPSGAVECLQKETAMFGIQSIIFEPGLYRTKIFNEGNVAVEHSKIPDYIEISGALRAGVTALHNTQPGDPTKAAERMVDIVRKEGMAAGKMTPLRLPLGADGLERMRNKCLATLRIIEEWEPLILSTALDA